MLSGRFRLAHVTAMLPHLDAGDGSNRLLRFLEVCALPPEKLAEMYKRPPVGSEHGLITIERDGVRANTAAFWWTREGPLLTISILALLHVPLINREEIIDWIKRQQHADGTFGEGKLGNCVRGATYAACVLLRLLGEERDEQGWARATLVELLQEVNVPASAVPLPSCQMISRVAMPSWRW